VKEEWTMAEGRITWTSARGEFGFFSPDDGSRSIFMRISSDPQPSCATGQHELADPLEAQVASTGQRGGGIEAHALASRVEVRTRYQRGDWAPGYEIAEVVDLGYHVRRPGSLDVIPGVFVPADVRRAGDGR
jgi:hypothetical protein